MNTVAAFLEMTRSASAIEVETINTALTIWFEQHPGCKSEIAEYRAAQRYLDTIAGDDDQAAEHLQLVLARDWYRALFGHNWTN